ncbi:MAG: glycosyltransferase [Chthonomonas sp.]|nr:glycosyltransferase [Chthonomonas sp.]
MSLIACCIFAVFLLVGLSNMLLMRRALPTPGEHPPVAILIPARNEEQNLAELLPELQRQGATAFVYDDDSTDQTAAVAKQFGATLIRGGPLPDGWTGKNHACAQLARAASEAFDGEWMLFLDADVKPKPGFVQAVRNMAATRGVRNPVLTGMPELLGARGDLLENAYLLWVPWILGCANPLGIVARLGVGHNRFLNGQFVLWRASTYWDVNPHETLRDVILEDVRIGRLLAKRGIRVEVMDLSQVMAVRMYHSFREALDGMSKNSYEITGTLAGTLAMAAFFFGLAGLSLTPPGWAYLLLMGSGIITCLAVRRSVWLAPLMPLVLVAAGYTFLRSAHWHLKGAVQWKGRTYGGPPAE